MVGGKGFLQQLDSGKMASRSPEDEFLHAKRKRRHISREFPARHIITNFASSYFIDILILCQNTTRSTKCGKKSKFCVNISKDSFSKHQGQNQ